MISRDKKQVKLEFGNGDICIAGGVTEYEDGHKTGFVIYVNQEPREIGSSGVVKAGEINLTDYPVLMTFSNKESIDVVIGQLEQARSLMD